MAVDAAGKIYASNETGGSSPGSVSIYNSNGLLAQTIVTPTGPQGVAVAPNGNVWMAIVPLGTVQAYSPAGTLLTTIPASSGLYGPTAVAVDSNEKVYVTNNGGNNVTTYLSDGTRTTPTINISTPYGIAVDAAGKIYVANGSGIYTFNPDGSPSSPTITGSSFGFVAVDATGNIYGTANTMIMFPFPSSSCTLKTYNSSGVPITPTILKPVVNCTGVAVH